MTPCIIKGLLLCEIWRCLFGSVYTGIHVLAYCNMQLHERTVSFYMFSQLQWKASYQMLYMDILLPSLLRFQYLLHKTHLLPSLLGISDFNIVCTKSIILHNYYFIQICTQCKSPYAFLYGCVEGVQLSDSINMHIENTHTTHTEYLQSASNCSAFLPPC